MNTSKHIGYFVNQYPAVSHSFIRREILALESLGWQVSRFAIRPSRGGVVDAADHSEAEITKFIVNTSAFEFISIITRQLLANAVRFFGTLIFAFRFNARHQKNLIKTLICFFEACVLSEWSSKQGIGHIHAHFGTNSTTIAMFAKRLGGLGYSFTAHGPEEFDKPETLGLHEKIRQARFVVAISSYGRSQLNRWADFADWEKIKVVHCGLSAEFLEVQPPAIPYEPELVCVGRLSEQKGQLLLLQAVARLVDEGIGLKLLLVGDGPMRSQIESLVAKYGLAEHVELAGSLSGERIRAQLARASIFVLPSFAEGLPVVIMEAFAMGRVVISTYVAGIPELVINGDNGWLVPAGSLDDLVNAMREALRTPPEILAEIGLRGRQRVLERHDIAKEAEKLSELFSDALHLPSASTSI